MLLSLRDYRCTIHLGLICEVFLQRTKPASQSERFSLDHLPNDIIPAQAHSHLDALQVLIPPYSNSTAGVSTSVWVNRTYCSIVRKKAGAQGHGKLWERVVDTWEARNFQALYLCFLRSGKRICIALKEHAAIWRHRREIMITVLNSSLHLVHDTWALNSFYLQINAMVTLNA